MNFKHGDRVRVAFEGTVYGSPPPDSDSLRVSVGRTYVATVYADHCERIAPTGELGPFNVDADYPAGTIVVNDVQGGASALFDGSTWRGRQFGYHIRPGIIAEWSNPVVVYIGRQS